MTIQAMILVKMTTGVDARDWKKGIFPVRRKWMIKICVKAPSVNQLVWARGTRGESSVRILYLYQFIMKTHMSKTLDVGPIKIIKRAMDLAFQIFGPVRYSGSTLSLYISKSVLINDTEAVKPRERGGNGYIGTMPLKSRASCFS